ncbi:MAG: ATP phosphoribosyltransferase regulatory subunit [Oscillospiraceae bacterium]|jgi:ATP phosphoribosyltransferase regulatory subunit|nr:ATP phosphoribosyltransferase regulatory subunit [Oscillospiraceae bacterium]
MKPYAGCTPEGTRDLLFEECRALRQAEKLLGSLLTSRGYHKVITPTLEFFDVFRTGSGDNHSPESLYSLFDPQGRMLVLRPDSTLPIARIAATRLRDAVYPLRLYYCQSVFRRSKRFAGEQDETMQGGLELIGAAGLAADLEVLTTSIELLERYSDGQHPNAQSAEASSDFRLEIGHAGFFAALTDYFAIPPDIRDEIHTLIAAKDFAALGDLLDTIEHPDAREAVRALPELFGGAEVLDRAEKLVPTTAAREALGYLRKVYELLKGTSGGAKIALDLSPNSWGSYYTGLVFRGYSEGCGHAVLSGGRYDNLMREYGKDLPAIGMGVKLGELAKLLQPQKPLVPDILVFAEPGHEPAALECIRELTASGLIAEFALQETLSDAQAYAAARGIDKIKII